MYYGNNYSDGFQQPKVRKNKSHIFSVIIIFILIIIIIFLAGAFLYFREINKYESKLIEYDNFNNSLEDLLDEYRSELENINNNYNNYEEYIADLENKLDELSDFTYNLENNMQKLSNIDISSDSFGNSSSIINISDTAAKVSPSVIGIKIYVPSQNTSSFWQSAPIEASGSGIILTEDGYIVTNYHVVSYAVTYKNAAITVILSDETEYSAEYMGGDELNDLAVIKINAKNLPYAKLGLSGNEKVGDFVIAIGNPLGEDLYGSVTLGIISGVNRKIEAENVAEKLIQTDAAINPGNSGGALLNLNGEVIGINTVKISTSNIEGIGFAIPMDYAKPLIDSIIEYGYVKDRPTLGVSGTDISSSMSRIYNVPRGLYVENIDASSGAENAGIKYGDIIIKIDGESVNALSDISKIVKTHKVGDAVTLNIWRNGSYYDLNVVLTEQR